MQNFKPGDTVRIKSGPFASFIGAVKQVDAARGVLSVEVEVFARRTPVEVTFSEAERVPPQPPYKPPLTSLN
jgi:transcription termination/antitermination protein NusG